MSSVVDIMASDGGNSACCYLLLIGGGVIGLLLLVILLPISFSYLDFYDYGLLRRHTTGRVQLYPVYEGGRHLVGPDYQ